MRLVPLKQDGTPDVDSLNTEFAEEYLKVKGNPRWVAKPTVAYLWARTVTCKNCRATARFGRGFSERNLLKMRTFYLGWEISPTPSAKLEARAICPTLSSDSTVQPIPPAVSAESSAQDIVQTVPAESRRAFDVGQLMAVFPLSWSHYVRLMSIDRPHARVFYESDAQPAKPGSRRGASPRQPKRQGSSSTRVDVWWGEDSHRDYSLPLGS